jgi:hypothetical protein
VRRVLATTFAKVGVEGSNPFARSKICHDIKLLRRPAKRGGYCHSAGGKLGGSKWRGIVPVRGS